MNKPNIELPCPECGRKLHIPPGEGQVNIACKGCFHLYSFEYDSKILLPKGALRPAASSPGRPYLRGLQITLAITLGAALCLYIYFTRPDYSSPAAPLPASKSTLEEIRGHLKSLAD